MSLHYFLFLDLREAKLRFEAAEGGWRHDGALDPLMHTPKTAFCLCK